VIKNRATDRTSPRVYVDRPDQKAPEAREAWDAMTVRGKLTRLQLVGGLWHAERANGEHDMISAAAVRERLQRRAVHVQA
jgi:hypothetical protein